MKSLTSSKIHKEESLVHNDMWVM